MTSAPGLQYLRSLSRPIIVTLIAIVCVLVLYSMGIWLELLWYSALDSTDQLCHLGRNRILFTLSITAIAALLAWPAIRYTSSESDSRHRSQFLLLAAVLCGLICGLGLWELAAMLTGNSTGAFLLELNDLCHGWRP